MPEDLLQFVKDEDGPPSSPGVEASLGLRMQAIDAQASQVTPESGSSALLNPVNADVRTDSAALNRWVITRTRRPLPVASWISGCSALVFPVPLGDLMKASPLREAAHQNNVG